MINKIMEVWGIQEEHINLDNQVIEKKLINKDHKNLKDNFKNKIQISEKK